MRRNKWCKECAKARRPERRETEIAACRRYKKKDPQRWVEYAKRYQASAHGRKMRSMAQLARQARQKAGMDGPESPEVLDMYKRAKDLEAKLAQCVACDDPLEMKIHVDHIIPLSKGGRHAIDNLQLLSARENMSKGARV